MKLRRWFGGGRPRSDALILCFGVNEHFLSHVALPEALRLPLRPGLGVEHILDHLPRGCRLVLPAINLTRPWLLLPGVEDLARALAARGIRLANRRVEDQGKRALHAGLAALGLPSTAATAEGDPGELLLVKSELNSGAIAERQLAPELLARLGLPEVPPRVPGRDAYPLLPRAQVPAAWFADPWLQVERFVARPDGISFRLLRAGRHGAVMIRRGDGAVIRAARAELLDLVPLRAGTGGWEAERLPHPALPAALSAAWQVAEHRGLDFGALDLALDATDRAYVIDLNATPHQGIQRENHLLNRHLRAGLLPDCSGGSEV